MSGLPAAERNRQLRELLITDDITVIKFVIQSISYKIDVMDIDDHLRSHGSAFNTEYMLPYEFLRDDKIT